MILILFSSEKGNCKAKIDICTVQKSSPNGYFIYSCCFSFCVALEEYILVNSCKLQIDKG